MQHITPFRKIETVKGNHPNGSKVQIVDADTHEVIFEVIRPFTHCQDFRLMRGKQESFNMIKLDSMGIIEDVLGEPKHVKGWGSRSLNPNFNMFQKCTFRGLVKLGKNLAQFETNTFEERTILMEAGLLKHSSIARTFCAEI
jgi:hypothetical protein